MRFKIVIILLTVLYSALNAQNINVKREITWKTVNSLNNPTQKLFNFKGAIYENSDLPYYYERFKLSATSYQLPATSFQVNIENPIYDELKPDELEYFSDSLKVSDDISIETNIKVSQQIQYICVKFFPFRRNKYTDKYEKLSSFELAIENKKPELRSQKSEVRSPKSGIRHQHAAHSVLASGSWYKIAVTNTGIQKLSIQDLANASIIISSINPKNLRIYGNGGGMLPEPNSAARYDDLVENPIYVAGENDGTFSSSGYILFYARGPNIWKYDSVNKNFYHIKNLYSDYSYYFLNTDIGPGKRIQSESSSTSSVTNTVTKFNDYAFHERDSLNLIKTGRQWYGEVFDILTSYNFSFNFPDIDTQTPVLLKASTIARSDVTSNFTFTIGGSVFNETMTAIQSSNYNGDYASINNSSFNFTPGSGLITVNASYDKPISTSVGWLCYLELNVMRNLVFRGGQLLFRNASSVGSGAITQFIVSNANSGVNIWDITNPVQPQSVQTSLNGSNLSFKLSNNTLREFIAYDGSTYYTPAINGKINNQDLHASTQPDLIIVTYPDFANQAQRIASIHQNLDKMNVLVTTPDIIYNEFSSGAQDITAIRDFIKMFYDRSDSASISPKYLLLLGDASYDYKNRLPQNSNLVPTYESPNSLEPVSSYNTDDFYGLLDDNEGANNNGVYGDLDIGIGRFPVKDTSDAKGVVDKITRYVSVKNLAPGNKDRASGRIAPSNFADWKNWVCFVAHDKDDDLHLDQAESLANQVASQFKVYNLDKIYFDAFKEISYAGGQRYPDCTTAIDKRVDNGAFLINYTGHGGQLGWGVERVIEITDINSWNNKYNLPIFMTATCEFATFDDPSSVSAGNLVFTNPNGGGIALFTTTRVTFSQTNFALNQTFLNNLFTKTNGKYPRLGDIIRLSKVANNSNQDILNFILLGDPALLLAYPKYDVSTSSVTEHAIKIKSNKQDTLKAFSQITVTGSITDDNGAKITSFNGILYPTVFDKPDSVSTLSNDGPQSPVRIFAVQKSIIFKGMASIHNGDFTFSFIIPKDIKYSFGLGKISYYAVSDSVDKGGNIIPVTDANGYYNNIIIGGSSDTIPEVLTPPVIHLYLDNTSFISGGSTGSNPLLLAYLSDNYGISTTGISIGHDITAILDDSTKNTIILNDYYQTDLDTYKSGSINYYLSNLSQGMHTLTLKAWNIFDLSSEAKITFFVVKGYRFYSYPNPFSLRSTTLPAQSTNFCFEHNYSLTDIHVRLQLSIYSLYGKFMRSFDNTVSDSFDFLKNTYRSSFPWDGKDYNNNPLPPGIYIFNVTATNTQGLNLSGYGKILIL